MLIIFYCVQQQQNNGGMQQNGAMNSWQPAGAPWMPNNGGVMDDVQQWMVRC